MDNYTRRSVEQTSGSVDDPVVNRVVTREEQIQTPAAPIYPPSPADTRLETAAASATAPAAASVQTHTRVDEVRIPSEVYAAGKANQILWFILGVLEALLAIRFVLRLIGANPANGFANFIYTVTGWLVAPFVTLLGNPALAGSALEVTTLVAMLVYALLFWGITQLFKVLVAPPSNRDVRP